jgi:hypothetical protein
MDIVPGAAGERAKASAIAGFLEQILHPRNGPYAVIVWTKHPEVRMAFEEAVFRSESLPRPVAVEMIEKHEFDRGTAGFDVAGLTARLTRVLSAASPLLFFKIWEEASASAAADVTNSLSGLADPNAPNLASYLDGWRANFLSVMHAIARASAEKQLTQEHCSEAIFSALNPLHADKMEQAASRVARTVDEFAREVLGAPHDCGQGRRSRINGMVHVAMPVDHRLVPGGIYRMNPDVAGTIGISVDSLLDDLVNTGQDAAQHQQWVGEVRGDSLFIAIEVSAVCDHAQQNIRTGRFLGGLLIPSQRRVRIKGGRADGEPQFFWPFGPVHLDGAGIPAGEYYLVVSGRHPAQVAAVAGQDMQPTGLAAVGRLRGQAFGALQTWLAGQSTRPGILFLRP